jgi:hypothetical protein
MNERDMILCGIQYEREPKLAALISERDPPLEGKESIPNQFFADDLASRLDLERRIGARFGYVQPLDSLTARWKKAAK